jgi:hypothetical protein
MRLLRDHVLETFEVRHERSLIDHADLTDDGRALFNGMRVVRPHDIRAHPHELRKTLRHDAEVAAFQARADAMVGVQSGPRILRTETAAIAALAALQQSLGISVVSGR